MSYNYKTQRPWLFTEEGQLAFIAIRDKAKELIKVAGCVTSGKLMCITGDSWNMLACVDRLVEIGELHEIVNTMSKAGQHRVFVSFDWGT